MIRTEEQRIKQREYSKKWRQKHPEKHLAHTRKFERLRKLKRYGLTEDEYQTLLISQNHVCAICGEPNSTKRDWHIDHCHTTGKIRGLLCSNCNTGIGQFKEDTFRLTKAINYITQHKGI